MKCRFCANMAAKDLIYKDSVCYVLVTKYPTSKGHLLVIPKRHYADMLSAPDSVVGHCFKVTKRFAQRINKALKPANGIKVITNLRNAEELHHMHIHIIPIYRKNLDLTVSYMDRPKITEKERAALIRILKGQHQ